jgi:NADPH2:quinone reductase
LLVVGFASGSIPKYPVNLALLKGCSLVGVFWGDFQRREPEVSRQNTRELFELFGAGTLKPVVSQVFPLEEYAAALNTFINRQAIGKVVLKVRG